MKESDNNQFVEQTEYANDQLNEFCSISLVIILFLYKFAFNKIKKNLILVKTSIKYALKTLKPVLVKTSIKIENTTNNL